MKITRRYLAGLLDGEGYFGIMRLNIDSKYNRNPIRHNPAIKMASTSQEIISLLQAQLGGYVHYRDTNQQNHKPSWCWEVKNFGQVKEVLDYVYPYLIIKRPQAEILKEFLETYKSNGLRLTDKQFEERERLCKSIRVLNYRGIAPATTE